MAKQGEVSPRIRTDSPVLHAIEESLRLTDVVGMDRTRMATLVLQGLAGSEDFRQLMRRVHNDPGAFVRRAHVDAGYGDGSVMHEPLTDWQDRALCTALLVLVNPCDCRGLPRHEAGSAGCESGTERVDTPQSVDPYVHYNWDLWPHAVLGLEGLRVTKDPTEVTCGSCLHTLGHQKYEPKSKAAE